MSKINVLSFEVANLIAAGEVVDRPASVLKELLENAIDSGANSITAEIKRGGVASIRVSDNGCGMDSSDLPLAIKRHATSKISTAEDLDSIFTLGFRGEALAAISSVSKLTIISKTQQMSSAVMLVSNCGSIDEITEIGANDGTTVLVEDLFANVPARRKFLKKDVTEASAALAIAERVAMSRPDISFTFISDGNTKFSTPGDGKLENALYTIFGRDFATRLIPVENASGNLGISVRGFIGRSDNVRNSRNMQNVFINSRYIKSKTVIAALEQGFTSFIAPEKFPTCALFIDIDPHFVDVNVHPAKLEVKFSDEKKVFEAVYYAVKSALAQSEYRAQFQLEEKKKPSAVERLLREEAKTSSEQISFTYTNTKDEAPAVPSVYSAEQKNTIPTEQKSSTDFYDRMKKVEAEQCDVKTSLEILHAYKQASAPISSFAAPSFDDVKTTPKYEEKNIFDNLKKEDEQTSGIDFSLDFGNAPKPKEDSPVASYKNIFELEQKEESTSVPETVKAPSATNDVFQKNYKIIGEAFLCYVMVEQEQKLIIIDKHAAHERILFEELKEQLDNYGSLNSQPLLVPIKLTLDDLSCAMITEFADDLTFSGYEFEVKSPSVIINAIPDSLASDKAEELFLEMINEIMTGGGSPALSLAVKREKSLYQIACKAAIKGGRDYDRGHIDWLVEKVMAMPDITVCPHGRPIAMVLTKSEFDRKFNRLK